MKLFLVVVTVLLCFQSFSQRTPKQVSIESHFVQSGLQFTGNIGIDFALGDFSNTHSIAPSVGFGAYTRISNNILAGLNLDESYFPGKKMSGSNSRYSGENILRFSTSVLVRDNSTSILGGLKLGAANVRTSGYSNTSLTGEVSLGIPLLRNIPLVGRFFFFEKSQGCRCQSSHLSYTNHPTGTRQIREATGDMADNNKLFH